MNFLLPAFLFLLCTFIKEHNITNDGKKTPRTINGIYKDTAVTNFFKRSTGCIAGDAGFSVPLTDNKVLWLMGDSHIDDYDVATKTVPCLFQVRNAALLQPKNNWNQANTLTLTGMSKGSKSFLKNNASDDFFCWPGAGIQQKDTLYIYCSSLMNQGSGAFGFAASGNDFLAKIKVPEMKVAGYSTLQDFNEICFGVAFIKTGQWVYVYGQKYLAAKMECDLYVARFDVDKPTQKWQFWNGVSWSGKVTDAKIIASQTGVSGTFNICKVIDKILLLSSQLSINCDSGTEMYTAIANGFTGPFSQKKLLYTIDDKLNRHSPFFYAAIAHPEYINVKEELLITYAINGYGTCVPDCVNGRMDPDVYRLRAIRVPCGLLLTNKNGVRN